jgi:hypothetical protein
MVQQSKLAQAWDGRIAFLRSSSVRGGEFADLLATVDPRWRGAIEVMNGDVVLRILPAEGARTRGLCLQVGRPKSGFSMDLMEKWPFSATTVERARPALPDAPAALDRMLHAMLGEREPNSSGAEGSSWDEMVGEFRVFAVQDAAKAELLASVAAALRERLEIDDNGQDFGITRIGDSRDDGEGVWISQVSDGWSFVHRVNSTRGSGSRILSETTARAENATGILNGLLEALAGGAPAPELSAQDAYRRLLRDHVGPALRHDGYKGAAGDLRRTAGEFQVSIQFQKSHHSTRARVDYLLNISVQHSGTAERFHQANTEARALERRQQGASAGMYHQQFPGLTRSGRHWLSLRPDEDLADHAATLLSDIRGVLYPAIEEQLRLPLPPPTPPPDRATQPSREELNREMTNSLLRRLQAAGFEHISSSE